MSVAREEEPVSLISSMPPLPGEVNPLPPMQTPPLQHAALPPIPTPSTEDSSTASSVTETELVGKHISEGELLLSCGQMVVARDLAEDGLTVPNLNVSLSSSLHEVQDMDYDPPSEGQVMRRPPHIHQNPANRGPVPPQEEACSTESLWDEESSLGEVSKGQRPPVAADIEHALRGLSLLGLAGPEMGRLSSPGQVPLTSGVDHRSISFGKQPEQPAAPPTSKTVEVGDSQDENTDSDRQLSEASVYSAEKAAPLLVRQYQPQASSLQERGLHLQDNISSDTDDFFQDRKGGVKVPAPPLARPRSTPVKLAPAGLEEELASISSVEGDTDSSGNNFF